MCYGKPREMLDVVIEASTLVGNDLDHTVLDDFEHFCTSTGCDPSNAWAKLAFVCGRLPEATHDPRH